jgi:hypothetical protein
VKVLMADGSPQRTNDFQLSGPGYHYRIVRSAADLQKTLGELGKWDILLHALYLGNWQEDVCITVPCIVEAFERKKIRGVICTTSIETDARRFVAALRSAGVPCKWHPFMYSQPSNHTETVLEDIPLVVKGTTSNV